MASKRSKEPENSAPEPEVVGIICALNIEIAPFLTRVKNFRTESGNGFQFRGCRYAGVQICVIEGGTGAKRAQDATHALIDAFNPPYVISTGFCGGLQPSLKIGDIVVADRLVSADGQSELTVDLKLQGDHNSGIHVGGFCMANHIVRLISEKQELAEATKALVVDMESLAVAQVCRERGVKFIAVRAVSDDMEADLPPEVLAILGSAGGIRAGALFGSLIKRPSSVKDLWKLRENAQLAAERLAQFLPGLIKQLGEQLKSQQGTPVPR